MLFSVFFFPYPPPSPGGISVYEVILSKPRDTKKMFAFSVRNMRRRKKTCKESFLNFSTIYVSGKVKLNCILNSYHYIISWMLLRISILCLYSEEDLPAVNNTLWSTSGRFLSDWHHIWPQMKSEGHQTLKPLSPASVHYCSLQFGWVSLWLW